MGAPLQGPCVVVATEGVNKIWLRHRGTSLKVALESVRLANEEDLLGNPHVLKALEDMQSELTGQRRPFFDNLTADREIQTEALEFSEKLTVVPLVSRRLRAKTRPEVPPEALDGSHMQVAPWTAATHVAPDPEGGCHTRGPDPETPVDLLAPAEPIEEHAEPSLRDSGSHARGFSTKPLAAGRATRQAGSGAVRRSARVVRRSARVRVRRSRMAGVCP